MDMSILFRYIGIILGLLFGFFAWRIFLKTKGALKGWKYLAVAGFAFFAWAIMEVIIQVTIDSNFLSEFLGFLAWTTIGVTIPLGAISLVRGLSLKIHHLFTIKNTLIIYAAMWLIMLLVNFVFMPFFDIMRELAGIAHANMVFILLVMAVYPFYIIWQSTRRWMWMLFLIFVIFLPLSQFLGVYSSGCCDSPSGEVAEICGEYHMDYAEVLPLPCNNPLLPIAKWYHLIEMPFLLSLLVGFYGLWKSL